MTRLISLLAVIAFSIGCACAAEAQYLRDPDMLARYQELQEAAIDGADVVEEFELFVSDYLEQAKSSDALCLFGCNSGFAGNGPDYTGYGQRAFLAHSDVATLANKLGQTDLAIRHLSDAVGLLSSQASLQAILDTSPESNDVKLDVHLYSSWRRIHGCVGVTQSPAELAGLLNIEVGRLRQVNGLTTSQESRLNWLEAKLSDMEHDDE